MDLISALQTFLRVAETGSFSAAAQHRKLTQPAVSRQITALEAHLETRLLHRTTSGIALTEEGHRAIPLATRLIEAADELRETLQAGALQASGKVRLSVPTPLGLYLSDHLGVLLRRHPGLSVELMFREGASDLVSEGIDIEVRLGEPEDSALITRRLGWTTAYLVASPAYFKRRSPPRHPDEIATHECIAYMRGGDHGVWRFQCDAGIIAVKIDPRFQATNSVAVHRATLAGSGLSILSHILAVPDIECGRLVNVMPDYPPLRLPIHAVYPSRQNVPLRVKMVLDFLAKVIHDDEAMQQHPAC